TFNFAINIIQINEDESYEYIRKSNHNESKPARYINLYENHFSYIIDIMKYTKSYICTKCDSRFKRNEELVIHSSRCNPNEKESFEKYDSLWSKKLNVIYELLNISNINN